MNRPAFVFQCWVLRNPKREHPVICFIAEPLLRVMGGSRWFQQILKAKDLPKAAADFDLVFPPLTLRCTPSLWNHGVCWHAGH